MKSGYIIYKILLTIVCFLSFSSGFAQINLMDFLRPIENKVFNYDCFFVRKGDTIFDKKQYQYKTVDVNNLKFYYLQDNGDTMSAGPNHFLFSALLFQKTQIKLADFFFTYELSELTLKDFVNTVPAMVQPNDTVRIKVGDRTTLLSGFKMADVEIPTYSKKINCLLIDHTDIWPETTYRGQVWISKEYGIVKWIRVTGRTEYLIIDK